MTRIDDLFVPAPMRQLLPELAAMLSARGVEAFATGGFVRDALLGVESRDLDLSVDVDPRQLAPEVAEAFGGSYFPMSEDRALVRVLLPAYGVHIDLLPLAGSLEEDLLARDYTVNAMAARLSEVAAGSVVIIDPAGGLEGLHSRTIRLVSEEALAKDPLRLLRAVRLAVQLDFEIEQVTADAVRRNATSLPQVAVERQRDELLLMLRTDHAARALRLLDELALLDRLLSEAAVMRDVEQPKEHHWDVLGHSFAAVEVLDTMLCETEPTEEPARSLWRELWSQLGWWENSREYLDQELVPKSPRRGLIKLAAFLHDVGKPETKSFQEDGRMRFFGHHKVGADIAKRALRRLRFSSREVAYVRDIVQAHMRPLQMAQAGAPSRKAIYRFFRDTGDAGIDTLFISLADHLGTVGPRVNLDGWRRHVALVSYVIHKRFEDPTIITPPKLVTGEDLMAEFGLPAGERLGEVLDAIRDAQGAGEISTPDEAIALARRHIEQTVTPTQ